MAEVKETLTKFDLFDGAVLKHGFTSYMRDYELIAEILGDEKLGVESGVYRYQFTHCPHVQVLTRIGDDVWPESWSDLNLDAEQWDGLGFLWSVSWAGAYPGLLYEEHSKLAAEWTNRLHHTMHEVKVETNVYLLQVIFHTLTVEKLSEQTSILEHISIPVANK